MPRVVDGRIEEGPFVSPYAYQWFIEGELAAAKGRHDDAAIAFETASAAPSDDVLLMTRLAEEYERSGASRRADRTLWLARRSYPTSAEVALAEARIRLRRGQLDEALTSLLEAKSLAPTWEEPVIELAQMLRVQGHGLRADAVLLDYIANTQATNAEAARRVLLGLAHSDGDAETLQQALALGSAPNPEHDAFLAAQLAYQRRQPALAARLLEHVIETPESRVLWLRALIASGDRERAREYAETATSAELGGPVEHAELLIELDQPHQALALVRSAAKSPRVKYVEGMALLEIGDYAEASRLLAEVPPGSSAFEEARIALAETCRALGRAGAAVESISLAPKDSPAVRSKRADLHLARGDLRAALRLFDAKNNNDRAAVAALLERAGRYREAAAYYTTVEAPEDKRVQARAAAERLAARGLHSPAATVLARWAEAAPNDLYARVRVIELLEDAGQHEAAAKLGYATLPFVDEPRLRAHLVSLLEATQ